MKDLSLYIYESQLAEQMLLERNEKMFPRDGQTAKFEIWTGDHCKQRQEERNISDKEIIDVFFNAYSQLNKAFKEREFKADRDPKVAGDIVIIDARKDKQTPLTICCWLYKNRAEIIYYTQLGQLRQFIEILEEQNRIERIDIKYSYIEFLY